MKTAMILGSRRNAGHPRGLSHACVIPVLEPHGVVGVGAGFPLAIHLFVGWEKSASLAEETEKPRRNIPSAMIAGTLAIGMFYIFLVYAPAVELNGGSDARYAKSVAQLAR